MVGPARLYRQEAPDRHLRRGQIGISPGLGLALLAILLAGCNPPPPPRLHPEPVPSLSELAKKPIVRQAATLARQGNSARAAAFLQSGEGDLTPDEIALLVGLHVHAAPSDLPIGLQVAGCTGLEGQNVALRAAELELADWRLYVLARCQGRSGVAIPKTLRTLVERFPKSPLAAVASLDLVASILAGRSLAPDHRKQLAAARRFAEALPLPASERLRLAELGWRHARLLDRAGLLRAAARTILRDHPGSSLEAEILQVLEVDEATQLPGWFTADDRVERAERAIERRLPGPARVALESLTEPDEPPQRAILWARLLIAEGKGREALEWLNRSRIPEPERACLVSEAAMAAQRGRAGRRSPPRAEREALGSLARRELATCAARPAPAANRHWRRLLSLADAAEDAAGVQSALSNLAPDDPGVVEHRWQRGWSLYREREYAAALEAWDPLASSSARTWRHRAARYWSADAYRELGHEPLAAALETRLIDETTVVDFYRHHLENGSAAETTDGPTATVLADRHRWPADPRLARASDLVELGLEPLALRELELLEAGLGVASSPPRRPTDPDEVNGPLDPAASEALRARALANRGQPRASILPLIRAFPELGTAAQDLAPAAALDLYYPLHHEAAIRRWSQERDLDPAVVLALIRQESAFDHRAVSRSGARGLMQLMIPTARELAQRQGLSFRAERLHEPEYNVRLATAYLRQVLDLFDGELELALAGYNAGPYRIRRWWAEAGRGARIDRFIEGLPMEEPRTYVKRVLLLADSYRHHPRSTSPPRPSMAN